MKQNLVVVLAAVALLGSIGAWRASRQRAVVEVAPVQEPYLASIAEQLARLDQRLVLLEQKLQGSQARVATHDFAGIGELEERLARLEELALRIEKGESAAELRVQLPDVTAAREELATEAIEAYRERMLDPRASVQDKLAALEALRDIHGVPDARDESVVQEALRVLGNEQDPRLRAGILRHLKGVEDARLAQQLQWIAAQDASDDVRQEAVETLGPMASKDPAIAAFLESLMSNDPSLGVRSQALEALREMRDE